LYGNTAHAQTYTVVCCGRYRQAKEMERFPVLDPMYQKQLEKAYYTEKRQFTKPQVRAQKIYKNDTANNINNMRGDLE